MLSQNHKINLPTQYHHNCNIYPLHNWEHQKSSYFRVESDVYEEREENKMWLVRHLEILRQTVVDDLLVAKFVCRYSFPPSYNIFDKYVIWYHEALSLHVSFEREKL